MSRSSVLLIHPSRLFSEGLAKICECDRFEFIYVGCSADNLSRNRINGQDARIFIIGGENAARTVENVCAVRRYCQSSVIIVAGDSSGGSDITQALGAGANCYLRETTNSELLLKILDLFTQEDVILSVQPFVPVDAESSLVSDNIPSVPASVPYQVQSDPLPPNGSAAPAPREKGAPSGVRLSARESAILRGLVKGYSNKVIANRLNITDATVKVHVKAILRKMGAKNRTQAAIWAVKYLSMQESDSVSARLFTGESSICVEAV